MSADLELDQRRQVAQRVMRVFVEHASIRSIIVFGSVATGTVDAYSDVDMLVICHPGVIPAVERALLLEDVGTGWIVDSDQDNALFAAGDKDGMVDNILVTAHYQTTAWINTVLHEVIDYGAITTKLLPFRPYTLPSLLQRGWLLYDVDGHVEAWRDQVKHYPPLLKQNILQHFTPILQEQTDELVATARRSIGPRNFLFHLNRSVDALISILYALNNVYDPADRRAAQTVWPLLHSTPKDFVPRLNAILEGPFDPERMKLCAQQYSDLAQEVITLASAANA